MEAWYESPRMMDVSSADIHEQAVAYELRLFVRIPAASPVKGHLEFAGAWRVRAFLRG